MNGKIKMPSGIPYIVGNETAERFSYYGMKSILTIFMIEYLRMPQNQSTEWLHFFGLGVYLLPLIGAFLSDFVLGKYKTILTLSIVYCFGHLVLALYESQTGLAIGLTLIAIGSGGIKPCVSAHVGDQFDNTNKELLPTVFNYFYIAINFGAFISSLATPLLLKFYGPSVAFGIPGVLMMIATYIFWLGRKKFVHIKPFGKDFIKILFSKKGLEVISKLAIVYLFIAFFWSLYDQISSTWVAQSTSVFMDKTIYFFGYKITLLPSQIGSINPILILALVPIFTFFVYPHLKNFTPLRKITVGMIIASLSFVIIGLAEDKISEGLTVSIYYQFLAYLIITIAEVLISVTALEFSYSQAPNEMKSFIMSLYLLSISVGNGFIIIVNKAITQEVTIENIGVQTNKTTIQVNNVSTYTLGEKFNINNTNGLKFLFKKDTVQLTGTFLVGTINDNKNQFNLWNINRKNIISFGEYQANHLSKFSIYRIKGAHYFYFFALMMMIASFLFFFISENYKGQTYIQEEQARE